MATSVLTKYLSPQKPWYVPHHFVEHNDKHFVFSCSVSYHGQVLNNQLLPGMTSGPSLTDVLIQFCLHRVAISGDTESMFYQVRLLPDDRPLLRFPQCNIEHKEPPEVQGSPIWNS